MPQGDDASVLVGSWLHSYEEDAGDRLVFRSDDFDFPPARGRDGFELLAGGELRRSGPGADDRRETRSGSWSYEGGELTLETAEGRSERFAVESAERDRLVLRRLM